MRIAQSATSIESYHILRAEQRLQPQQQRIMALFTDEQQLLTRKQIAKAADIELSSVCAAVNTLVRLRQLQVRGVVYDPRTRMPQETLGLPLQPQPQAALF